MVAKWYVIRTRTNSEFQADTELTQAGFEPFLPFYHVRVKRRHTANKFKDVPRALFPGYMFCRIGDPYPSFGALHDCKYVIEVMKNMDGVPIAIVDREVAKISNECANGVHDQTATDKLAPGATVEIEFTDSPFDGQAGAIERLRPKQRKAEVILKTENGGVLRLTLDYGQIKVRS